MKIFSKKSSVAVGEMGDNNIIYNNPWEQAEIEVDRISEEFMQELADAINKEVERQMKAKEKESLRNLTTRELMERIYKK